MYKNEKRSTLFSISRLNNNGNKVRSMYKMYQTIKYKQTNINKNKQKHFQHFYLPIPTKISFAHDLNSKTLQCDF